MRHAPLLLTLNLVLVRIAGSVYFIDSVYHRPIKSVERRGAASRLCGNTVPAHCLGNQIHETHAHAGVKMMSRGVSAKGDTVNRWDENRVSNAWVCTKNSVARRSGRFQVLSCGESLVPPAVMSDLWAA
jgi:hypothetical protein